MTRRLWSRGMVAAGIIGAAVGMYAMLRLESSGARRRLEYKGGRALRSARRHTARLGHVYQKGKQAVQGLGGFGH